jgi:hypothetical protein
LSEHEVYWVRDRDGNLEMCDTKAEAKRKAKRYGTAAFKGSDNPDAELQPIEEVRA